MSKAKALIFDLSGSISFGRLSLLGKVLFPMLVLKSDDQGRGLAEPDAIKWKVCPSVKELTVENIDGVLQEMADSRIDLVHLYEDDRGRQLYQFKRWWVPDIGSGSCLQWARPSEYAAPEGWVDRVRIQQGPGNSPIVENWDTEGGFIPNQLPNQLPNRQADPDHSNNITQHNTTKQNTKQLNITQQQHNGADAPAADAVSADDALSVLIESGMNEPEAVMAETDLQPWQIVETVQYAEQEKLGAGWVRSQLRLNNAYRPRAPDDGRRRFDGGKYAEYIES